MHSGDSAANEQGREWTRTETLSVGLRLARGELPMTSTHALPVVGQMVRVRSRQYLVEGVQEGATGGTGAGPPLLRRRRRPGPAARGALGDARSTPEILDEAAWRAVAEKGFDRRGCFAAYLHTLRWNCVTATDPELFQSPFRAGIEINAYQLEPLRKALRLPRVNLFIADDVGLGKTIEAGLIVRELLLRQKVRRIVVAAPAVRRPAVAGRAGAALRPDLRGPRPRVRPRACGASAASASTRGRPTPASSSRTACCATRPTPTRCATGWADFSAGSLLDPRRGPPRRAGERRALRHRLAVHAGRPRPRPPLRAPALPLRHAAQRPLEQLLRAARDPRPAALLPRRAGQGPRSCSRRSWCAGSRRTSARSAAATSPSARVVQVDIDGLPSDAPELRLSRLLDEYARGPRSSASTTPTKSTQTAAALVTVAPPEAAALVDRGVRPDPRGSPNDPSNAKASRRAAQVVAA